MWKCRGCAYGRFKECSGGKNLAYQSDYLRLREMKDDAREEGREEGVTNTISVISKLKRGQISARDAAKELNVTEDVVKELME